MAAMLILTASAANLTAQHHGKDALRQDNDRSSLANATVSFGGWMTTPSVDRFPNLNPRTANHHIILPYVAKIKAGGYVNFVIGGFHQVLVYGDGSSPASIRTTPGFLVPVSAPPGPPLINDPFNRVYRGLDPSMQSQDRVEVVHFQQPGMYLVLCGVLPHFREGMYAYVKVLPPGDDNDFLTDDVDISKGSGSTMRLKLFQ